MGEKKKSLNKGSRNAGTKEMSDGCVLFSAPSTQFLPSCFPC
jgi:hypothetical protein